MLAGLTLFIADHRSWAGPIIGLIVLAESLAVIGLFFPATPIMFAIGGMLGTGTLDPVPAILWALLGAVAGDGTSYALGRRIGPSIYYRVPFNRHVPMFAKARLFFQRYGFAAIFVGRFLGPFRTTVPLVSGVAVMEARTFQTANILSALLWVPASFAPGYLAMSGLGAAFMISQSDLIVIGGAIALLSIVAAIGGSVIFTRKRAKKRER
jgi:membrane protein DedA with SNARE-associated domain